MHCCIKAFFRLHQCVLHCPYSTLRIGVDEAGRGAVLGPLVISSILLNDTNEEKLRELGIKDSKQMTSEKRFESYDIILEKAIRSCSYHISSLTIDKQRKLGLSLNRIEENHIFELLKRFQDAPVDMVLIDAFVSKQHRLEREASNMFPNAQVLCEFHADANHTCVAAASIIAKVERDRAMIQLSKENGVELGTGYPHDPITIAYLRDYIQKHGKAPVIARSSWVTTQRLLDEVLKQDSNTLVQ